MMGFAAKCLIRCDGEETTHHNRSLDSGGTVMQNHRFPLPCEIRWCRFRDALVFGYLTSTIECWVRQRVKLNAPLSVRGLHPLRNKKVRRRNSDLPTLRGDFNFTVAGTVRARNDETNQFCFIEACPNRHIIFHRHVYFRGRVPAH